MGIITTAVRKAAAEAAEISAAEAARTSAKAAKHGAEHVAETSTKQTVQIGASEIKDNVSEFHSTSAAKNSDKAEISRVDDINQRAESKKVKTQSEIKQPHSETNWVPIFGYGSAALTVVIFVFFLVKKMGRAKRPDVDRRRNGNP
jgi:hypothetical protein